MAESNPVAGIGCVFIIVLMLFWFMSATFIVDLQRRVGQLEVQVQQLERRSK